MRIAPSATLLLLATLPACGSQHDNLPDETTDQRFDPIIGGVLDTDSSHDGVVQLESYGGACTGALISQPGQKGVILTARHCVSNVVKEYVTCSNDVSGDLNPANIRVNKGTYGKTQIGYGEKLFHTGGTSLCDADIALMVMKNVVTGVTPLRVRVEPTTDVGEVFTSFGYGLTNPNNYYSSGTRYLRNGVSVTKLGPGYGVYGKEFLGTTSICSGDSGGPAVSAAYAVMGVTSRGASCYGNDNIWTRPDKFRDLINQAITYANATYLDEDGNVQDGTNTGGTGGTGGTAGMGGTGGSSGEAGSGGVDPGTGGTGGDIEPVPGCGNSGPCGPDSTCLVDSTTGDGICGRTCNEDLPCVEGVCDPTLGVCVTEGPQPKAADGDAGSDGSCGVSSPRGNKSGVAGLMLLLLGAVALRRRR